MGSGHRGVWGAAVGGGAVGIRVDVVWNSKAGVMTTKQMLGVRDSAGTLRLSYSMERMREQFNKQHLVETTARGSIQLVSEEIFNMAKLFFALVHTPLGKQQDLIDRGRASAANPARTVPEISLPIMWSV